jgi:glycine betaine/proline transport system substrate-binding protein
MKIKNIILSALVVFGLTSLSSVANAACGKLVIAEQNWASAELMANVDKIILEKGYGCEVELVPGATMPTFTSMNDKGTPDMNPEQWANAVVEPLKEAVAAGRIVVANKAPITGLGEGWWITPGTIKKHPEIKGMTALQILEHPEWFPSKEDPSKGAFVGCPAGWGCQIANANLFRAFEMEKKGWVLIDPGSAAGLDGSISKAADSGDPWFGYYWNPTSMVGKYDLQPVDFGVPYGGDENWNGCIVKPEQECANPKPSAWTHSEVNSLVTANFAKTGGKEVLSYVEKRTFPGPVMNGMLVYMADNQAKGSDAAVEFLVRYPDVWTKWVPADVADKIRKGIGL